MERCKKCDSEMAAREVEKRVEVGDNALILRIVRALVAGGVLLAAVGASCESYRMATYTERREIEAEEVKTLLADPNVKVEIIDHPSGSPTRKFTRE